MGTYSARESTATLRLLGGARGAWASTGEERGGGILCRHTHRLLFVLCRPREREYSEIMPVMMDIVRRHKAQLEPAKPQLNICDRAVMVMSL